MLVSSFFYGSLQILLQLLHISFSGLQDAPSISYTQISEEKYYKKYFLTIWEENSAYSGKYNILQLLAFIFFISFQLLNININTSLTLSTSAEFN